MRKFKIHLKADNYLVADHRIDGLRVLPGVAYLDILARCLQIKQFALSQISYPQPAILKEGEAIDLCIAFDEDSQEIEIYQLSHKQRPVHFKALFEAQTSRSAPIELLDAPSIPMEDMYRLAQDFSIEHGEFMQVLGTTQIQAQSIGMQLRLSSKASPFLNRFYLHPALLDGASFAIAALHYETLTKTKDLRYLPLGIDKVQIHGRLCSDEISVRAQILACTHDLLIKCRIQIFSKQGDMLVELDGLTNFCSQKKLLFSKLQQTIFFKTAMRQSEPFKNRSIADKVIQVFKASFPEMPTDLEAGLSFFDLGFDSSQLIDLVDALEQAFGLELYPTLLFEYNTLEKLADYLSAALPKVSKEEPEVRAQDVAIIGLAFELPKAQDLERLWEQLSQGKNAVESVNRSWSYKPYPWGAYLDKIAAFDPLFFNISPAEAALMDPQERLFLSNAWHCLEDAGYATKQGQSIGVIAAAMFHLYQLYGVEQKHSQEEAKLPQSLSASIANRVSYALNLTGPSFSLDSMCSSSLTAIDLACHYLASAEVDAILVGGVNLCSHPYKLAGLVQNKFLSSSGVSAPFSQSADGYVPGEGVVVLLLKNAMKAMADGDSIYALIKGIAINHGGQGSGFTVPNAQAQTKVIQEALKKAGLAASQIQYVEAHGTGTVLGDPIELEGIKQAYGQRPMESPLYVGSIKSNIGHLESAAAMAGILKVIAQFQQQRLAPSIHALPLNPALKLDDCPIRIVTDNTVLRQDFAGISSFGAGGSNGHLILQNLSKNLVKRPKTHFKKDSYWLAEPKRKDLCLRLDFVADPLARRLESSPAKGELGLNSYSLHWSEDKNSLLLVLLEPKLDVKTVLILLEQSIASHPDLQFCLLHQFLSSWRASHALMLSSPHLIKHYAKNILIPQLSTLDLDALWQFMILESEDKAHRMIAYSSEGLRQRLDFAPYSYEKPMPSWTHQAQILILGGLGTLGRQFAQGLKQAGILSFDLLGRRALDEESTRFLQSLGSGPQYLQHDFSKPWMPTKQYDLVIDCLGLLPDKKRNLEDRALLRQNLLAVMEQIRPKKLVSISSLSALVGFSTDADYALSHASCIDFSVHCLEHVVLFLPYIQAKAQEHSRLAWIRQNQGLEPLLPEDLLHLSQQWLALPAGEYLPFKGDLDTFLRYLKNDCFSVPSQPQQFKSTKTLYQLIEAILELPKEQMKASHSFWQLGFNSLSLSQLADDLSKTMGKKINPALFFELQTLGELEAYLDKQKPIESPSAFDEPERSSKLAITGFHCSFAQCPGPWHYWQALVTGKDCTQSLLTERFAHAKETQTMGLICDYAHFDHDFFGIGAEQAKYIDPQQRKLLELSWHVFEQAGVSPLELKGESIGVFVAIQFDEYAHLLSRQSEASLYQITGCAKTFAANRISQFYDFHGPSETVDTACSSSLTALNRAALAISAGECASALVLAVSFLCDPRTLDLTAQLQVLSSQNRCRPFDAKADGYVKGEGLAGLWLMSQQQAKKRHLRIHAHLEALQVNHGGFAQSLTAPNLAAQKQLLHSIYSNKEAMEAVDYIEAHATGTRLGDPIEWSALKDSFQGRTRPLYLGSVKSNIGHTEPVAGMAGIIKALEMFEHQIIPPQTHFTEANPHLDWSASCFKISTEAIPASIKRIGINCFGFGGSNAHCLLSKAEPTTETLLDCSLYLIALSAKSLRALEQIQAELLAFLAFDPRASIAKISYTLNARRADFDCRRVFLVKDCEDLKQQLASPYQEPESLADPHRAQRLIDLYDKPEHLKNHLLSLAQLYICGESIDWGFFYENLSYEPLRLPVYPFERNLAWFEDKKPNQQSLQAYQAIWVKKEVELMDLSSQASILVFLRSSQQRWIKGLFASLELRQAIYYVLVDDEQQFEESLDSLTDRLYPLIYYFAGMQEEQLSAQALLVSQEQSVAAFLKLIQQVHRIPSLCLYVYSNQAYALGTESINPYAASLHGLAQAIKKEYPQWRIECIDLPTEFHASTALRLSSEGQAFPLLLRQNLVWQRKLQELTIPLVDSSMSDKVLVFIGGNGQLGKQIIEALIPQRPKAIVVASRHVKKNSQGALHWLPLDCTNELEVEEFIHELIQQYGQIDCLYHLAASYSEMPVVALWFEDYLLQMRPKVLGSYQIIKACRRPQVLQVVIASSVQVYTQNKNRAAYTAACFYADALVEAMGVDKVKILHWGFWQQEDEVANQRMRAAGILPILPEEGVKALQGLCASDHKNLSFFQVTEAVKAFMPMSTKQLASVVNTAALDDLLIFNQALNELEHFSYHLIKYTLVTHGLIWSESKPSFIQSLSHYAEYFMVLIRQLKDFEKIHYAKGNTNQIKTWDSLLQQRLELSKQYPALIPFLNLVSVCAKQLLSIVREEKSVQEVIFPYGHDHLVKAIYQDNVLAYYYNLRIAEQVAEVLAMRARPLTVLEIGAGVGATTAAVLEQCQEGIEYIFTDINPQFVRQASLRFKEYSGFQAQVLDINQPVLNQSVDIIIAANALHLGENLRSCILALRSFLKADGLFIITEASANSLFLASTFGLFKQWHASKEECRIQASPLMTRANWTGILEDLGFEVCLYPTPEEVQQLLIVAKYQGLQLGYSPIDPESSSLLALFARFLNTEPSRLDRNKSLKDYALDSLAAIHLSEQIKQEYGLSLSPTLFLEDIPLGKQMEWIKNKKKESEHVNERAIC